MYSNGDLEKKFRYTECTQSHSRTFVTDVDLEKNSNMQNLHKVTHTKNRRKKKIENSLSTEPKILAQSE